MINNSFEQCNAMFIYQPYMEHEQYVTILTNNVKIIVNIIIVKAIATLIMILWQRKIYSSVLRTKNGQHK